ncbi:MAG: hypothetical protein K1X74_11170 [Pirellulales bacterium]|nr:hypothetical protein [Pirellulales bacterium]
MVEVSPLIERIRGEFSASEAKLKQFRSRLVDNLHARKEREARLERIFEDLREVWRSRLETLAQEFGDRLELTPKVEPGHRLVSMHVQSALATIKLQLSAAANSDVTQMVLAYDLDILPILMEFERHAELALPLDEVRPEVVGQWLDDRIVEFVHTYLSLYENEHYLKDQMVDDPIARVSFPKFAAGAKRERGGQTIYFISEETAAEFDRQSPP